MKELTIIVVSYNTKNLTLQCLSSLFENLKGICYEVYVVDNASNDGSVDAIKENFPTVNLIVNEKNRGFAYANNQAITKAHGNAILLLNSDTIILSGSIEAMYDYLMATAGAGAVGCQLVDQAGQKQFCARRFPTIKLSLKKYFSMDTQAYDYKDSASPVKVEALSGACLMIRAEVLKKTGALDENFFMYSEDIDLCYRIIMAGWANYFMPGVKIIHLNSRSLGNKYFRNIFQFSFHPLHHANYAFYKKNHNFFLSLIYWIVYKTGVIYLRVYGPAVDLRNNLAQKTGIIITRKGIKSNKC